MTRSPFHILIPARKLLDFELASDPTFLGGGHKKGSYPVSVETKIECCAEGVHITIDPLVWNLNQKLIGTPEYFALRCQWEAELIAVADSGGRAALVEFPSFEKWTLQRRLAALE